MYTQCPNCNATFRIEIRKLRASRGKVACRECQKLFNALDWLAETPGDFPKKQVSKHPVSGKPATSASEDDWDIAGDRSGMVPPQQHFHREELPSLRAGSSLISRPHPAIRNGEDEHDEVPQGSGPGWWVGGLAMLALLAWQISIFEGEKLVQNERLRPWLELACESVACELTPYKDTSQIQVVDRSLLPAPDDIDGYEFRVIISNQSSLAQAFPSIRLVLSELGGRAIASRTFEPDEYLDMPRSNKMPVGKPFEIRLLLAKPSSEVGGFSFELI